MNHDDELRELAELDREFAERRTGRQRVRPSYAWFLLAVACAGAAALYLTWRP
jgi:hypothetical protein